MPPRDARDPRRARGAYHQFHVVRRPAPPTDPTVVAWVAGFSDAESCMMYKEGTPVVSVSNCHLPTLCQLCDWYGGAVRPLRDGTASVRPCYQWSCAGGNARFFLAAVLPYLREKRAQADLILGEPVRDRRQPLTDEDCARRVALRKALAALKRVRSYPTGKK